MNDYEQGPQANRDQPDDGENALVYWRLLPANRFEAETKATLIACIASISATSEKWCKAMDILEPIPHIPGRARLLAGLDCKSPVMVGKILSGAPIGNKVWQTLPDLRVGASS